MLSRFLNIRSFLGDTKKISIVLLGAAVIVLGVALFRSRRDSNHKFEASQNHQSVESVVAESVVEPVRQRLAARNEMNVSDAVAPTAEKTAGNSRQQYVKFISESHSCLSIDSLLSSNRFEDALFAVEAYLDEDISASARERMLLYRGNILFACGKTQAAYDVYRQLLLDGQRNDVREWATVKLYATARQLGETDALLNEIRGLYDRCPDDLRLATILADLCAYHGSTKQEITVRKRLLDASPADRDNAHKLMAAYSKVHAPSDAANVSGRLAVTDPANGAVHLLRQAMFLLKADDKEQATSVCDAVMHFPAVNAQALLRCGYLYEQLGNLDQAFAAFTTAASIAEEQYRKERCSVEALRIKRHQSDLSPDDIRLLDGLSANAQTRAVRALAKDILDSTK